MNVYFNQDELDDTAWTWNAHVIRPSRNPNVPSGRPNIMFSVPELYQATDHLCSVDEVAVEACATECTFRQPIPCDPDVYHLCNILMAESQLNVPDDPYQALNLYMHLRDVITAAL